jgi:uncharacterized membrane protein YpjA
MPFFDIRVPIFPVLKSISISEAIAVFCLMKFGINVVFVINVIPAINVVTITLC